MRKVAKNTKKPVSPFQAGARDLPKRKPASRVSKKKSGGARKRTTQRKSGRAKKEATQRKKTISRKKQGGESSPFLSPVIRSGRARLLKIYSGKKVSNAVRVVPRRIAINATLAHYVDAHPTGYGKSPRNEALIGSLDQKKGVTTITQETAMQMPSLHKTVKDVRLIT